MATRRKKSAFEDALDFVGNSASNLFRGASQTVQNVGNTVGNFYNSFQKDYNNRIKLQQAQNDANRIKAANFTRDVLKGAGNDVNRVKVGINSGLNKLGQGIKTVTSPTYWDTTTPEMNYLTGEKTPKFWSQNNRVAMGLVDAQKRLETGKLVDEFKPFQGNDVVSQAGNFGVNIPGYLINSVYGQGITAPTSDILHLATDPLRYGTTPQYKDLNSGVAKIGLQIGGILNPDARSTYGLTDEHYRPQEFLGNIGQGVAPVVDAWGGGQIFKVGLKGFTSGGSRLLPTMLKGGANTLIPGGASVAATSLSANRDKATVGEQLTQTGIETATALPLIFAGGMAFSGVGAGLSKIVQKFGGRSANFAVNKEPIAAYLDGNATPEVKAQLDQLNGGDISTGQGPMWDFLREAFPEHFDENGVPLGSLSEEIKKLNLESPDERIGIEQNEDTRVLGATDQQGVPQTEVAFRRRTNPPMIGDEVYKPRNKIGHIIEPNDYDVLEEALYYLKRANDKGDINMFMDDQYRVSEQILKEVGGDYLGREFTKKAPIEEVMAAIDERLQFDKPDVDALKQKIRDEEFDKAMSNNLLAEVENNPTAKMLKEDIDKALKDTGTEIVQEEAYRTGPVADGFDMTTGEAEAAIKSMVGDAELAYINGGKQIITPDGELAHGKYYDSIISVIEQDGKVDSKTVYHEAFHAYVDKFVDKTLYKTALDDMMAMKKATEKQAAEDLAEGFAEYMAGRREGFSGAIINFFTDLLASIRTLMGKESAANMMYANLRRGNRTPNQGVAPKSAVNTAYADTIRNGGVTINLAADQPQNGFAYSPYKGVETIVDKAEFSPQNIRDFIAVNQEILAQPGNHIGMWESDGKIYMDVSQVGTPTAETLAKAQEAQQLAAFDLGTFEEIPLGTIDNGVYNKTYEAINHPYLNRGQDTTTNPARDGAGVSEVSGSTTETPEEVFRRVKKTEVTPPVEELPTPEQVINEIREIQGKDPLGTPVEPKKGQKKRGFIETAQADESVPQAIKDAMDADPRIFYDTYTNDGIMKRATDAIDNDYNGTLNEVMEGGFPADGIQQAELTAKAVGLARKAINEGNNDLAQEIIINAGMRATPLAQGLQSFSLWNRATPEGMLRYAEKEISKANDRRSILRSLGITSKAELDKATRDSIVKKMKEIQKMPDGDEKQKALTEVVKLIGDKIPLTASEIFDAYRYQNLLSNPLTHLRNFFGNNLQAFLLKPATTAVEAGVDLVGSKLQGRDRRVYFSEVPTYYRGLFNSVPLALENMRKAITEQVTINQPDLRSIRQSRLPKGLTIVPRFLEAGDRFFSTLIEEGEYAALRSKGIADDIARKQAHDIGQKFLFRNEIDPNNKTGQGYVLSGFDRATKMIYELRKFPGVSWFIPFIKTPMNIAKMQVEYSPLGYTTMIGNTNKTQQFAKATIGTAVSGMGALFAFSGRTTWAAPTDKKERDLFYSSGRQPYSILVNTPFGERWVPMQYLGPLATAFAIPAAMNYYENENRTALTDSQIEKAGKVVGGLLRQYSNNTYLSGLSDLMKVVEGDPDFNWEQQAANLFGQAVPLDGLVSYVARVVDPIYRKPEGFIEGVQKDIPFLSRSLGSYEDVAGNPSERKQDLPLGLRSANTLPYGLGTPQGGEVESLYQQRVAQRQMNALEAYNLDQLEKGGKIKVVDGKVTGVKGGSSEGDFLMSQISPDKNDYTGLAPEAVKKLKRSHEFTYIKDLQQMVADGTMDEKVLESELEKRGISKDDIVYDEKTLLADDLQLDQIKAEVDGLQGDDYLAKLVEMRRVSEGSRKALLTDTLINDLEDEGYLTEGEADYLKSIEWDAKNKTYKLKAGSGGKGKKIDMSIDVKVPTPDLPSIKLGGGAGAGVKEAYAPFKVKSPNVKLKLPELDYEPQIPQSGGGRVSAQISPMATSLGQLGRII